jgi:hypothetical protein
MGGRRRRLDFSAFHHAPWNVYPAPMATTPTNHQPNATPSNAELPIQEATLELIRWFIPILHRLPRQHRHGLGDRLITNLYELLEQLALARFQRERLAILEPLRGRIQLIQLQTRLLHDFQLIDLRRYEHASRLITAIGRQHSGWLSQQRRPA